VRPPGGIHRDHRGPPRGPSKHMRSQQQILCLLVPGQHREEHEHERRHGGRDRESWRLCELAGKKKMPVCSKFVHELFVHELFFTEARG